jgi:hypothetical protein
MSATRTRPFADLLRLFVGPTVWFMHLVLLYGAEALICRPPVGSGRAMLWLGVVATVAALGTLVFLAVMPAPRADGRPSVHTGAAYLHNTSRLLAFLSAVGVIWNALPVALVPVCALAAS